MVATMCAEFQAVEDLKHMNYCTFLTVLITVAVPASAIAQTASNVEKVVEVGASPHLRSEIKDDFKFGSAAVGNDEQYLLSQARILVAGEPRFGIHRGPGCSNFRGRGDQRRRDPEHLCRRPGSSPRVSRDRFFVGFTAGGPQGGPPKIQPRSPAARIVAGVGQYGARMGRCALRRRSLW